ncbi:hypothetical protein FA15DRAFT_637078 [Coprinopsis marcescibilis]|uniref:Uncharacterized protein n=1 Tax=Coprinopsis marcescibilis TaxID=230819 RepID=A0A5C3L2B6_COPMA|nr:hypothetical protein FA15DRAFT_637078 [Coprinopsis marcescibilis]
MKLHSGQFARRLSVAFGVWASATHLFLPANGHIAAWHKGMYCLNGTEPGRDNQNTNDAVNPLHMLNRTDWWMHHVNKCDEFPPTEGDFLELPVGGSFVVELATNRAFTTLSYNGRNTGRFGHGQDEITPDGRSRQNCVVNPNLHTKSEELATGTAFAISYHSNLADVTPENLVVFSIRYNTPWRRVVGYDVPQLPACPEGGCHCAWGWVPDDCGEPNMYMHPIKCKVVGNTGSRAVAQAVPPAYCDGDRNSCVSGAKQMVFRNQIEGNNIILTGNRHPTYNARLGFADGAQTDIFLEDGSASPTYIKPGPSVTPTGQSTPTGRTSGARRLLDETNVLAVALPIACYALFKLR